MGKINNSFKIPENKLNMQDKFTWHLGGVWYEGIHITPGIQIPKNVIPMNHIPRNVAIPMFGFIGNLLRFLGM